MTNRQLANHLNDISSVYLQEALEALDVRPVRRRTRTVLVLAAALAALLALTATAFAANWFGLRDLLLPRKVEVIPSIQEDPDQTPYESDSISLAGYAGTAEALATARWREFVESYEWDADGNDLFGIGTSYEFYSAYDETMADKLDEITAQFGLKLHTDRFFVDQNELCALVGGYFLGKNHLGSCYIYEDGTFHMDGELNIPGYGLLDYQFMRCVRGTFTDVLLTVADPETWQEWTYTTAGGTAVTLALSDNRGLILADLADSFVTVNVLSGREGDDIFSSGPIEKKELMALADSFDFTLLSPALPVDLAAVEPPTQTAYYNAGDAYRSVLEDLLYHSILPDGTLYEPFDDSPDHFALTDVDGDGREELILCCGNTYMAGMAEYVLSFDEKSGSLVFRLVEFPAVTYYEGGLAVALASHNQGLAGDKLWPYTLYCYDAGAGVYVLLAQVDAWDRALSETYMGKPFPAGADTSGTGVVYYVSGRGDSGTAAPMDITEYQAWYDSWLGSAEELSIPYKPLTEENLSLILD